MTYDWLNDVITRESPVLIHRESGTCGTSPGHLQDLLNILKLKLREIWEPSNAEYTTPGVLDDFNDFRHRASYSHLVGLRICGTVGTMSRFFLALNASFTRSKNCR